MMLYSIVIPVLNGGKFLRKCLDSILAQDYRSFEVVLVLNKGSTDNSSEIIHEYTFRDYRFRCTTINSYEGIAEAKRKGIFFSNGEYIQFLNCNDRLAPTMLSSINTLIEKFKNIDIIRYKISYTSKDKFSYHLNLNDFKGTEKPISGVKAYEQWSENLDENVDFLFNWLYVFKSSILRKVKFNSRIDNYEELYYLPKIIVEAKKVYALDKECYIYNYQNHPFNNSKKLDYEKVYLTFGLTFYYYNMYDSKVNIERCLISKFKKYTDKLAANKMNYLKKRKYTNSIYYYNN